MLAPAPAPRARLRAAGPSSTWTGARCSGRRRRRPGPSTPRCSTTSPSPSATATRSRSRSAPATRSEAAARLLGRGVELALVKMGGEGVLVATPTGATVVPPHPVEVVCGLGAGDAFGGALVHGLLSGWEPARCAEYANAAGALVASRLACADAMPTAAELDALSTRPARHRESTRGAVSLSVPTLTDDASGSELLATRRRRPWRRRQGVRRAPPPRPHPHRARDAVPRRRRPPGPRRAGLGRRRHGDGRPPLAAGPAGRGARATPTSTACSAPRTWSRSCCCSAPWRTRSSSAR